MRVRSSSGRARDCRSLLRRFSRFPRLQVRSLPALLHNHWMKGIRFHAKHCRNQHFRYGYYTMRLKLRCS